MPKAAEPGIIFRPWFPAAYEGECDECGAPIDEGDEIRRVESGYQGRECCGDDEDRGNDHA